MRRLIFNLKNCSKSDLGAVSLTISPRGGGKWGEGSGVEIRVRGGGGGNREKGRV